MQKYILYILLVLFTTTLFAIESDKNTSKLTNAQKVSTASSMISKMEATLKEAYSVLKSTRSEKDVVKLNCVNDSIKKIKGLLKRSKDDSINLQEAIAKEDPKSINYYYTKISLASNNIKQAGLEVLSCSGTITIETDPVVNIEVEELVVEKDYTEENDMNVVKSETKVNLEPVLASPYF